MRARGRQWESISLFSSCSGSWAGKQCMPLGGARISTLETLLRSTILDRQWPLFISTARGRMALVVGGYSRKISLQFRCWKD